MRSVSKWSERNACGCSKCRGPTEFRRWKVGDRRAQRRRGFDPEAGFVGDDVESYVQATHQGQHARSWLLIHGFTSWRAAMAWRCRGYHWLRAREAAASESRDPADPDNT